MLDLGSERRLELNRQAGDPKSATNEEGRFELIILGTGGGPLETDLSGYMLKPRNAPFEDGWIALEGGCGIGALAAIMASEASEVSTTPAEMTRRRICEQVDFPEETLSTKDDEARAIYQAGYLFGFLSAYVITHAHLDHVAAMIISTGSMPAAHRPSRRQPARTGEKQITPEADKRKRKRSTSPGSDRLVPDSAAPAWGPGFAGGLAINGDAVAADGRDGSDPPPLSRTSSARRPSSVTGAGTCRETLVPIYGSRTVLQRLDGAYGGDLWPELGQWATERPHGMRTRGGTAEAYELADGVGVQLCSMPEPGQYQRLPVTHEPGRSRPPRSLSLAQFPVSHGCTSHGTYESSAFFVRLESTSGSRTAITPRELLFWGDVESKRGMANGTNDRETCEGRQQTESVWEVAADRFRKGRLAAVLIECSYDASRPADKLYGHLQPSSLWAELDVMAGFVRSKSDATSSQPPLQDLPVYITHVKQSLVPHPSGLTDRERIEGSLHELEERARENGKHLGVKWIMCRKGQHMVV